MSRAWSKDICIEPHTFGGTKACEVLADMMNQDIVPAYEKHRTLAFINKASRMFNGATEISDKNTRNSVIELVNRDIMDKIKSMTYPPKYISYLRNVMTHYYRKALERVI
jgi:hypothetical protein